MRFLGLLKQQTAESHAGLEKSMDVFARVKSREDYRDLLRQFFTLYEPLEARLAGAVDWVALGWDFSRHAKTRLLRSDLQALGVDEATLSVWPRATALPQIDDTGAALGCLYVLEGSTLGGQMISRHFQSALGITPENGGAFFHGYGAETGARWRTFGQWAETQNEKKHGGLEASAVRAARETFNSFAQWLN